MMASDKPAVDAPSVEEIPLPPIQVPPPSPPKPETLPPSNFLSALDVFQAAGVVLFAFLIASFAVRNSDFFQHIATGRLIAEGNYSFGHDPFSYTTEGTTWVNHAWLFDWVTFQIYARLGGSAVVIFKALMIATLMIFLLQTRKSRHGLWFAIVGSGLALLASAPRFSMQPAIISFLFFGLTLFFLTRLTGEANRKRLPVVIGVLFALWSNCDQWFIFGPLTVAVFLMGELLPALSKTIPSEDRLEPKTLLITLGVGLLACMINPHHVQVWQLPVELFGGRIEEILQPDRELSVPFWGLFSPEIFNLSGSSRVANPVNSSALVFLFLFTVVGFFLNLFHLRWSHLLLWSLFLILAITRYRLLPFFSMVSVVVSTWNYGEFALRFSRWPLNSGLLALTHFVRGVSHVLSLLVGLVLIAMVRPGWLNQQPKDRLNARWMTWEVQPDEGLSRAAESLQKLREEGKIPPEAHALMVHTDFAHYVSWFAPGEKNFFDYRFTLHENHAAEYVLLREWLRGKLPLEEAKKLKDLFTKYRFTHLILAASDRGENFDLAQRMLLDHPLKPEWTPWMLEGRVWVLGWNPQSTIPAKQFAELAFDPTKIAFDLDSKPIDEPQTLTPVGQMGWLEAYWDMPRRPAPQSEDAFTYWAYQQISLQKQSNVAGYLQQVVGALSGTALPSSVVLNSDMSTASGLQSIRFAREAIVRNPDSPDAYFGLARVYGSDFQTLADFSSALTLSGLQRGLIRGTPEESPDYLRVEMLLALRRLSEMHREQRPSRIDLLIDTIDQANLFLDLRTGNLSREQKDQLIQSMSRPFGQKGMSPRELRDRITTEYENVTTGLEDPYTRAIIAKQMGLIKEARDVLRSVKLEGGDGEDTPVRAAAEMDLADLELLTGFVEEGYEHIKAVEKRFSDRFSDPTFREGYRRVCLSLQTEMQRRLGGTGPIDPEPARRFRESKIMACFLAGKFTEAAQEYEPILRELEQNLQIRKIGPDLLERAKKLPSPQMLESFGLTTQFLGMPRTALHWLGIVELQSLTAATVDQTRADFQILQTIHEIHFRLAMLYLEKGSNREALFHFEQAAKPGGIEVPFPTQRIVLDYIRLLKK